MKYFLIFFDSLATVVFSLLLTFAGAALTWWLGVNSFTFIAVGGVAFAVFVWFVSICIIEHFRS